MLFVYILTALLILLAVALVAAANFLINFAIRKPKPLPPPDLETLSPFWREYTIANNEAIATLDELPHEILHQTAHDGLRLRARFFPVEGDGRDHDTVLVVHGYRSSVGDFAMMVLGYYRVRGFNVLVVENRAHGQSEGSFAGFGALDSRDCADWCRILADRMPHRHIFLHGISMGAATVTIAASLSLPAQVKGVIADCGYTSAVEEFRHVMTTSMHIPGFLADLLMPIASVCCRLRAGYFFGEASPVEAVKKTPLPFLFVHGGDDDYVPTEMVYRIHAACPTEKTLLIVEGAGHGLSYPIDPADYEAAMDTFYAGKRSDR